MELLVEPGFEAEALAHHISRGDRQDGRRKQRGIEEAGRKQQIRILAGERPQRLGGISGVADLGDAR